MKSLFVFIVAILMAFHPVMAQQDLITPEGQVRTFFLSGFLIVISLVLRVSMIIISMPMRMAQEVLMRLGFESAEARSLLLKILGEYTDRYILP